MVTTEPRAPAGMIHRRRRPGQGRADPYLPGPPEASDLDLDLRPDRLDGERAVHQLQVVRASRREPDPDELGGLPGTGGRDLGHEADALRVRLDRKSTRLNSSHVAISYAVFCLKKKINTT